MRGEAATANKERRKERQRVGIVGDVLGRHYSSRFTMLAIADMRLWSMRPVERENMTTGIFLHHGMCFDFRVTQNI